MVQRLLFQPQQESDNKTDRSTSGSAVREEWDARSAYDGTRHDPEPGALPVTGSDAMERGTI